VSGAKSKTLTTFAVRVLCNLVLTFIWFLVAKGDYADRIAKSRALRKKNARRRRNESLNNCSNIQMASAAGRAALRGCEASES
jgi:hypothetical protein